MLLTVPDRTQCPRCQKTGLVRRENVLRGDRWEQHFYCGACNYSWRVTDGELAADYRSPPPRPPADD
jgi:transposase-like protein